MASSSSPPHSSMTPVLKEGECRNWARLPSKLTSSILRRLDPIDILENAQKVCTSWRGVCKDPAMWLKIDMRNLGKLSYNDRHKHVAMCRHAVDRSQGGLVEIGIWFIGTDSLLNYIAYSSSNLRSLNLAMCSTITSEGLTEALVKLPLLEELEVSYCSLSAESLKVVGRSCPNLKTLKLNREVLQRFVYVSDDDALAIAETMPRLSHLQLFGNKLTYTGLTAILDNCPDLEHVDLRQCLNVTFIWGLEERCTERIKVFRRPYDSTDDYPYNVTVIHMETPKDPYHHFSSDSDYSDC
ncbi:F-box protein SKIP19 [Raphanus sativus]|uniref:F-box protein SKIP19-like n=1 Tax=Raphanus sativus TaxID=3726 RepID=A0A9W3CJN6_RAPSA|nr:F-box protein SKIP19-like [Raphanus sativus]KAJ4876484.1 F-box protein SKIP19 [Raphanus sativus]